MDEELLQKLAAALAGSGEHALMPHPNRSQVPSMPGTTPEFDQALQRFQPRSDSEHMGPDVVAQLSKVLADVLAQRGGASPIQGKRFPAEFGMTPPFMPRGSGM